MGIEQPQGILQRTLGRIVVYPQESRQWTRTRFHAVLRS